MGHALDERMAHCALRELHRAAGLSGRSEHVLKEAQQIQQ